MLIHTISFRLRAIIASSLLTGFALVSSPAQAQTYAGKLAIDTDPAILQVTIQPTPQPSVVMLCIKNASRAVTHIVVRDEERQIMHVQDESYRNFALPINLASATAGLYTVEVSTKHARHTETFRVEPPMAGRVVLNNQPASPTPPTLPATIEVTAKQ